MRLTACVVKYGYWSAVGLVLRGFKSPCPYDPHSQYRQPQKYGFRCGAYLPDLTPNRPPDLPPSMTGLPGDRVAEPLDVIKDVGPGCIARAVDLTPDPVDFQG